LLKEAAFNYRRVYRIYLWLASTYDERIDPALVVCKHHLNLFLGVLQNPLSFHFYDVAYLALEELLILDAVVNHPE